MEAYVTCYDGTAYALPVVLEWEFSYALGSPCDAFSLTCVWEPGMETLMAAAVRFRAAHGGQTVFTGVVDEYDCIRDERGGRLELSGRGMQALLLDNESLPMEYQTATVQDILRDHVSPYGIELAGSSQLGAVAGFTVSTGESEWSVVYDFACYYGGIVPRFDREGRLILSGWQDETAVVLGDGSAFTRLSYGEKRYGVLSQVVVRDRSRKVTETVNDTEFQARGGRCRRVVTTTGKSDSAAMRYSGQFQLRASRAERVRCEVTVPGLFHAFPGQLVTADWIGFAANGVYRVAEAVTGADSTGSYTQLTLGETDIRV